MTQAFLPMSSLAHIFPISNQRAIDCADILKRISQGGTQKINMSEFYLNETQQQLHLALCEQPRPFRAGSLPPILSTALSADRLPCSCQSARATKTLMRTTTRCSATHSVARRPRQLTSSATSFTPNAKRRRCLMAPPSSSAISCVPPHSSHRAPYAWDAARQIFL
jgi:hypothetical protein